MDKFRWNEKDLTACEERVMDLRKEKTILAYSLDLAEEEDIEKGRQEGKIEVAKAMLADNVDINTIVKFTGLSVSEIKMIARLKDTYRLT